MSDTAAYQRAKALFLEALERPAAERVAFVQAATDGDAALRDHVLGLLEADEEPAPSVEEAADAAARPEGFGSFRILGFLGEGGMGRVYEAEQDRPRRRVALKVMAPIVGTPAIQRRFEHEAEVLGQLDHPGIARVFDADVTDTPGGPRPWIAMELVAGRPLLDYIQLARPSVEELLDLFARIADSVAHAHRRGIIHRDLKPGNILVQDDGAPKLLDFGVSKLVDEQRTLQTRSGEVLGTLPYVSPEHIARGAGAVDARSDIYALGVMLYEALTGRHPLGIENDTFLDAVAAILQREPRPLGARRPELRGDVELIVATAMHKDPVQRYASVEEFAADVRRYLHHEPIRARPPSAIYKLRRFVQRQRALVVSALSIAVALIVATVVSVEFAIEESRARSAADARVAELEYRDALRVPARVQELLEVGQDELARGLLGEARPDEAIERAYLRHQLLAPQRKVAQFDQDLWRLRRSRDGQRFVAGGKDGIVVLVDAEGRERARWVAGGEVRELDIHPAGDRFAAAVWQPEDQSVALHLWEAGETRVLARAKGHAPPLGHVRFSADGSTLVWTWADGRLRAWDMPDARLRFDILAHPRQLRSTAVSPDGSRIATGSRRSGTVRVWDGRTGALVRVLRARTRTTMFLRFDPTGQRLLLASRATQPHVWDLRTGEELLQRFEQVGAMPNFAAGAFSRDGNTLYVGGYLGSLYAFDLRRPPRSSPVWKVKITTGGVRAVALSDDGRWIACSGDRPDFTLVDAQRGHVAGRVRGIDAYVNAYGFLPGGTRLASSVGSAIRIWDLASTQRALLRGHEGDVVDVAVEGARVHTLAKSGRLRSWDVDTSDAVAVTPADGTARRFILLDAQRMLWLERGGSLQVRDRATRAVVRTLAKDVRACAAVGSAGRVAWLTGSGELVLGDAASGGGDATKVRGRDLAVTQDGRRIAVATEDGSVLVIDADSRAVLRRARHGMQPILALAFSPDGAALVSASADGTVQVTDREGNVRAHLSAGGQVRRGRRSQVHALAFAPNGRRLVTGAVDGTLQLWDVRTWSSVLRERAHGDRIGAIAFHPDGRRFWSVADDGSVRCFDARPLGERGGEGAEGAEGSR